MRIARRLALWGACWAVLGTDLAATALPAEASTPPAVAGEVAVSGERDRNERAGNGPETVPLPGRIFLRPPPPETLRYETPGPRTHLPPLVLPVGQVSFESVPATRSV
jgi:hypothetical protein